MMKAKKLMMFIAEFHCTLGPLCAVFHWVLSKTGAEDRSVSVSHGV